MSTIGDRIRIRREQLNLSQSELAQKSGFKSRSSINKIELDQRNLTQSKIKAIADALDTTPSYIMGWEELDQTVGLVAPKKDTQAVTSDMIQDQFGVVTAEALDLFVLLDDLDKGKILGMMNQMLTADKYAWKGSSVTAKTPAG